MVFASFIAEPQDSYLYLTVVFISPCRVPSSQARPSSSVRAQCYCLCWSPSSSRSTRGLVRGLVPTRSTATGHRVTLTAPRAAGQRARNHYWKTAVYNLSHRGQTRSLPSQTSPPAQMDLRHTLDCSATNEVYVSVFLSTAQQWALFPQQLFF